LNARQSLNGSPTVQKQRHQRRLDELLGVLKYNHTIATYPLGNVKRLVHVNQQLSQVVVVGLDRYGDAEAGG
jgi:hypothetical protein